MTLTKDDCMVFRKIIREEVLMGGPVDIVRPLPSDEVAEQVILSAILNSEHKPDEFPSLKSEHFSEPLKRSVWKMASVLVDAGHQPELGAILVALRDQGFSGPVADDLTRIRTRSPSVSLWELRDLATRITELWKRRRLLEAMSRLRVELECGAVTHGEACTRLGRYIEEFGE